MRFAAALALMLGCPGPGGNIKRDHPEPSVKDVVDRLTKARDALSSFTAESVMDYWLGKDRVKGTVMVMGKPGAFVRLNALSPAGDSVIADLACDGSNFVMVDFQNNCVLTGPCNADSIAQFLHVPLAPDDFFHLATGTTPVVAGPQKVDWDGDSGHETITLGDGDASQTIVLDRRDGHSDLVSSHVKDAGAEWTIENKDFAEVADDKGAKFRIPSKSRFQASGQKSDLIVEWSDVALNIELGPEKFQVPVPQGLPTCGQQPTAPPAPAPHP
jgi:hypothetical protein